MQRQDLERMSREQLIAHAERLGIPRPRVLTQPELIDEIIGRTTSDRDRVKARGWLGRARDLLAKVVEKGLHLPEAARVLRQEEKSWPAPPPPLPTVTLAEIYAAQGHIERAITVLDEVLARQPDHREARSLRERFVEQRERSRSRSGRIETPPAPPPAPPTPPSAPPSAAPAPEPPAAEPAPASAGAPAEASPDTVTSPGTSTSPGATTPREPVITAAPVEAAEIEVPEETLSAAAVSEEPIPSTEPAPVEALAVEAPAVEALEEPPLPARYEVDEVVAIAVDPRTIYLYWEVRPTTLAHARAAHPEGTMCLRIASVTASWEGPIVDTRDLHVDALYGDRFVRDVKPGSNVRVSVGWKSSAGFEPLAVGAEVTAPRAVPVESVADDVARWDEKQAAPFAAWHPDARLPAAARAVEERVLEPFVGRNPPAPWSRPAAAAPAHGAPVDTGFAIWAEPGGDLLDDFEGEREIVVEEGWFVAGGSSELARSGPPRTRTVRSGRLVPGGASELAR